MKLIYRTVLDIIRSEIAGTDYNLKKEFTQEELREIFTLSKKHDLAHIIGDYLLKNDIIKNEKIKSYFENEILTAQYRYVNMDEESKNIYAVLESQATAYVPLKGAVIRGFYREPWMRTSCDIDVLVRENDAAKIAKELVKTHGYVNKGKNYHDISLFSPSEVHLELHFSVCEDNETLDRVLKKAWDYAERRENSYRFDFTAEYFLFYIIAHASYHFLSGGGCGIKPLIDLWLLQKALNYDKEELNVLLKAGGIDKFYSYIKNLINIWFENGKEDDFSEKLTEYIFIGGVYGAKGESIKNAKRKKSRFRYYMERIFLPYNKMCINYHVLKKVKILLPFCWVARWFTLLNKEKRCKAKEEIRLEKQINDATLRERREFLDKLGLY